MRVHRVGVAWDQPAIILRWTLKGSDLRGYVSFILVLSALLLLLSLLSLNDSAKSHDLSDAVSIERTYLTAMNAKEASMEAMRQGAREGFDSYDSTHFVETCKHCPDMGCVIPIPGLPPPPNPCIDTFCATCFREPDARLSARLSAQETINLLNTHDFDPDFSLAIEGASVDVFTVADPFSANKVALGSARLSADLWISAESDLLGTIAKTKIPRGRSVSYESPALD